MLKYHSFQRRCDTYNLVSARDGITLSIISLIDKLKSEKVVLRLMFHTYVSYVLSVEIPWWQHSKCRLRRSETRIAGYPNKILKQENNKRINM